MKKTLLFIPALMLSGAIYAQSDSKNAVVNVENDYTPEVIEVTKKSLTPSDETKSDTNPMELLFSKEGKRFNGFTSQKDINDILPRKEEPLPGYARVGYGFTNDINAKIAGCGISNGATMKFFAGLDGHKSDVNGLDDEWNSRIFRLQTGVGYVRKLETMMLDINGSFRNSAFNYQSIGNGVTDFTDRQNGQDYNIAVCLTPNRSDALSYNLKGGIEYVARQYSSGRKEMIGEGRFSLGSAVGYEVLSSKMVNHIGADLNLDIFTHNRTLKNKGKGYGNYCSFDIDPYANLKLGNWKMKAGLKINLITSGSGALAVAPDIVAENNIKYNTTVYGSLTGGRRVNSFARMNEITPYWGFTENCDSRLKPSYRIVDLKLGSRISFEPLSMDVSAGYAYTKDDLLEVIEYTTYTLAYANFGQDNTHHLFLDMRLGCDLNGKMKLSGDIRYDFWNCNNKELLIMKPQFTIDLNGEGKVTEEITVRVGYNFTRYTKSGINGRIGNRNDLYARVSYRINNRLGAYIEGNNLFNSKYYEYAGYVTRGIRASLGATVNF